MTLHALPSYLDARLTITSRGKTLERVRFPDGLNERHGNGVGRLRAERPSRRRSRACGLLSHLCGCAVLSFALGVRRLSRARRRASPCRGLLRGEGNAAAGEDRLRASRGARAVLRQRVLPHPRVPDLDQARRDVEEPARPHPGRRDQRSSRSSTTATPTASLPIRRFRASSARASRRSRRRR